MTGIGQALALHVAHLGEVAYTIGARKEADEVTRVVTVVRPLEVEGIGIRGRHARDHS